jgi:hypothetical protein
MVNKKVSFVCTTYRRFECVQRILAQYYSQSYIDKELIIFNTDTDYPYIKDFEDDSVIIINNDLDYQTRIPYSNRGQICRDAVTHATGEYFMLADDDDIYLSWHIEQAVDGITTNGLDAWKPERSLFATHDRIESVCNTLEASVIVKMNRIREIGFRSDITGYEGLSWYTKLRDEKQLIENNKVYFPSYCFNWSDPPKMAGHKQSGDIDNPNNFENHKLASIDPAILPLSKHALNAGYDKYYEYLRNNKNLFDSNCYEKYAKKYIG